MYRQHKTDYQKGYEDGKELVATHIYSDGKVKAKDYIQKLVNKNKGKTDAMSQFVNAPSSYFVEPQYVREGINNTIRLTEAQLHRIIKESVMCILDEIRQ